MIFAKKTVDSIIADINTRISHLGAVEQRHREDAEVHATKVEHHTREGDYALIQATRASRLAGKFAELIT